MQDVNKEQPGQAPEDLRPQAAGERDEGPARPDGGADAPLPEEMGPQEMGPEGVEEGAAGADPREAELAELKDRLLRTLAEMENLRQRTAREMEDARKYAVTGFARGLLDVADNLGRALAAVPPAQREQSDFLKNMVMGVEMTERTLMGVFERFQIKKVQPDRGERFDHNRHQAMIEMPTADVPPGTVADVMQPGYVIADRLLRPAMVAVAKAPAPDAAGKADGAAAVDLKA